MEILDPPQPPSPKAKPKNYVENLWAKHTRALSRYFYEHIHNQHDHEAVYTTWNLKRLANGRRSALSMESHVSKKWPADIPKELKYSYISRFGELRYYNLRLAHLSQGTNLKQTLPKTKQNDPTDLT